jgi:hypothetical protein
MSPVWGASNFGRWAPSPSIKVSNRMALSDIFDPFTNNAQKNAAGDQITGINAGIGQLNTYFGQGQNALNTNYAAGLQPFLQNYNAASAGQNMLGNSLGLNGPGGSAAALTAFQNSNPGYQFQLQQGENAVNANAAKNGMSNSGNTQLALQNFGQGLANNTYGQWQSQLAPYLQASNSAASGVGSLYSGLGNQLNANYMGQGNANYGAQTSIGNANANADLGALTGASNLWGLGSGLLGLGTGGGATLGGNLFNKFGPFLGGK